MKLDVDNYMHHLDGLDMTEEQKIQYIKDLSAIMQRFVDQAFDSDRKARIMLFWQSSYWSDKT